MALKFYLLFQQAFQKRVANVHSSEQASTIGRVIGGQSVVLLMLLLLVHSALVTETQPKIIFNLFRSSSIHSASQNGSLDIVRPCSVTLTQASKTTNEPHRLTTNPSGKWMNTSKDWRIFAPGSIISRALPAGCRYRDVSLPHGVSRQNIMHTHVSRFHHKQEYYSTSQIK